MAECADNSTECLLRSLIQLNQQILDGINESNDGFNWDPASFIVTLAIGALAFVVACITVFQGVLAAGQGRIKAGKTAIGPWSKHSTSQFSWTELGMKSTAMVPVIHIDLWSAWYDPWAIFPERSDEVNVSDMKEHGATWVNLLRVLGMTDVKWRSYKSIGTDYLPADIQGPPATVHMKTLITLAAIADDYCKIGLSEHGRFLTMTGLYTSISIRQHPVLGTVAAFEMHSIPRTAKPYIFMHSVQQPASALQELSTGERISATSAFDISAIYSLGEGRLCTGLRSPSFDFARCATSIDTDIHEIRSRFMHDRSELWPTKTPTIYSVLITGHMPSRPRMVPKDSLGLGAAARRLVSRSMWEAETSFPARFGTLLRSYSSGLSHTGYKWESMQWHSLMSQPFDYRWTRHVEKQRRMVAQCNRFQWSAFPDNSSSIRSIVASMSVADLDPQTASDSCIKAVVLKRFLDHVCRDQSLEIEGDSKIKHMFTSLDMAALQVGFQFDLLLLDTYLATQKEVDVACALMVLLKHISLTEQPLTTTLDFVKAEKQHRYMDCMPSLPLMMSNLSEQALAEAYGIQNVPVEFTVLSTTSSEIRLRSSKVMLGWDRTTTDPSDIVLTTPKDNPNAWADLWYNHGEDPEDRARIGLLAEIMRYRALLCIAILDLCADSSTLMQEHFERAMVKMI